MLTHFRKIAQLIYKTGCSYEKFRLGYRDTMDWSPAQRAAFLQVFKEYALLYWAPHFKKMACPCSHQRMFLSFPEDMINSMRITRKPSQEPLNKKLMKGIRFSLIYGIQCTMPTYRRYLRTVFKRSRWCFLLWMHGLSIIPLSSNIC